MKNMNYKMLLGCSIFSVLFLMGCSNQTNTIETTLTQDLETTKQIEESVTIEPYETTSPTIETTLNDDTKEEYNYESYAKYQMKKPEKGETIASIHVQDYGTIKVKFFQKAAPKAVENFITHAKDGYYNGLTWHRVMKDYIIQSGDPNGDSTGGESIWNLPFENECVEELVPYKGALCMANKGRANTNTSQFFIVTANENDDLVEQLKAANYPLSLIQCYKQYGGSPWLYQNYTVFGQVMEGLEIAEKISNIEVNSDYKPTKDIIIQSIEISEVTE